MKHIAVRSRSFVKDAPYTAPGLGDRIHALMTGYNYSMVHNVPVTLHLTTDKYHRPDKNASWLELLELFPSNTIFVEGHDIKELSEGDWLKYLADKGIDAQTYYYKDWNPKYSSPKNVGEMIDAAFYVNRCFPIEPIVDNIQLPEKFITVQFDSNNVPYWKDSPDSRKIKPMAVEKILAKYRSNGYKTVFIGGDATNPLLKGPGNLKNIGYALSKADYHVGADSGFFHFAQLYMQPKNIKIYYNKGGHFSHHSMRAPDKGIELIKL